jgi:inhibitor of cysteine peptidase
MKKNAAKNSGWKNLAMIFALVGLASALTLAGCAVAWSAQGNATAVPHANLPKFGSCSEIAGAFESGRNSHNGFMLEELMGRGVVYTMAAQGGSKDSNSAGGTPDYSGTNNQVAGVDEADFVKTDGRYIYTLSGGIFYIVSAYPADNASLLSSVETNGIYPSEFFINGDIAVIFGSANGQYGMYKRAASSIYGTSIQFWNISDRTHPTLVRELDYDGNYIESRMIGTTVYFVLRDYPNIYYNDNGLPANDSNIIPTYRDSQEGSEPMAVAACTDIGYLEPHNAQSFIIVGAVSIEDFNSTIETTVAVGSGESIYASENSLYVAEPQSYGWDVGIRADVQPVEIRQAERTVFHKFALEGGNVSYEGSMEAPGHLLNQFSMDEYNGSFRVATTIGQVSRGWDSGSASTNNVYVFGKDLKMSGKLEGLAAGEKIYSARFMGARAYLVTFKKVDPLFVIDLQDAKNPKVLGKLKIPGFSDYLHPIDENHIIGIGKDTVEAEEGNFAWYQGLKLAVFDVSNVSSPKEMHKIVIGDRGTDSYALSDHKAFLYDKEKDLLVLPVTLAKIDRSQYGEDMPANTYGNTVFQGAYVFNLTLSGGFDLRGRITHVQDNSSFDNSGYYYYSNGDHVKRSLFIGDTLYTVSDNYVYANSLYDLDLIKKVGLGAETIVN